MSDPVPSSAIHDATAAGKALLTAANESAQRSLLSVLTAAEITADFAAIGHTHSGVYSPVGHGHAQSDVTNLVSDLAGKQAALVSGTNLKTVNGTSLLGSGDLIVGGASADGMRAQTGVYYNAQEPDAFASAVTITANVLYLHPTCHETTETWNEIYTYVNVIGSGGTCRMGIYTSDHANGPTFTLLKNAGTVSVGTTGLKTISGLAQSIDGGKIVYLALLCDVTWTNLGTTFANLKKRLIRGHSGGFNFGGITGYRKAATYASGLPSTVTGVTIVQTNCPTIGMRI